jgi:hypothetical protein
MGKITAKDNDYKTPECIQFLQPPLSYMVPLAIVENAKYVVILKEFVVIGDGCGHCA